MHPNVLAFLAASGFSLWPFLTRTTTLSPVWAMILVIIGTMSTVIFVGALLSPRPIPTSSEIGVGLMAGAINGIGFVAYTLLLADAKISLTTYVPVVFGGIIFFTCLAAIVIHGEHLTLEKIAGTALMVLAIWCLTR